MREAKKTINNQESYMGFLKLFEWHARNCLDRDLIVDCAAAFIGHNTELMATLQTMIEHECSNVGIATRPAQSMAMIDVRACFDITSNQCDTALEALEILAREYSELLRQDQQARAPGSASRALSQRGSTR